MTTASTPRIVGSAVLASAVGAATGAWAPAAPAFPGLCVAAVLVAASAMAGAALGSGIVPAWHRPRRMAAGAGALCVVVGAAGAVNAGVALAQHAAGPAATGRLVLWLALAGAGGAARRLSSVARQRPVRFGASGAAVVVLGGLLWSLTVAPHDPTVASLLAGVVTVGGTAVSVGLGALWRSARGRVDLRAPRRAVLAVWSRWWGAAAAATLAGLAQLVLADYGRSTNVGGHALALVGACLAVGAWVVVVAAIQAKRAGGVESRPGPVASVVAAAVLVGLALPAGIAAATPTAAPPAAAPSGPVAPTTVPPSSPSTTAPGASTAATSRFGPAFDTCLHTESYLGQRDCYSAYFIDVADKSGLDAALDEVVEVHRDPAGELFRNHCHEVLHNIALDAASKVKDVTELFKHWRITCTGGFAHGVLVAYTKQVGWDTIKAGFPTFCAGIVQQVVAATNSDPANTSWVQWNCDHMVGHIAYENSRVGTDLDAIARGADLCRSWPKTDTRAQNCRAGFFMEHYLDVTRGQNGFSPPKAEDDVFRLCGIVDPDVRGGCYNEAGGAAIAFAGGIQPAFRLCATKVAQPYHDDCYDSTARMVTVMNGFKIDRMSADCEEAATIDPRARDVCAHAIASALVMELDATDAARKVCADLIPPGDYQASCFAQVDAVERSLDESGFKGGVGEAAT